MSPVTWLRQTFGWSNSWASWQERVLGVGFFLLAVGLILLSTLFISLWQSALAWSIYFIALAVCSRQGWIRLLGPVLFYDMICSARRSRFVIMRLLYAVLLLFVLCFVYMTMRLDRRRGGGDPDTIFWEILIFFLFIVVQIVLMTLFRLTVVNVGRIIFAGFMVGCTVLLIAGIFLLETMNPDRPEFRDRHDMVREAAQLGEIFFLVFSLVQLSMVVLLTPAYVAGAIAEEKDRKTLEFLLATDLNNREIVLSKLLSRVSNLTLFLLTGLPILSILQLIGGVDVQLMVVCFAGTGLAMLGIASVSILMSVLFKRPRDAIGLTYLILIAYMSIGTVGLVMRESGTWAMSIEVWFNNETAILGIPLWTGAEAPNLGDVTRVYNSGNPISAVIEIIMAIEGAPRRGGAGPLTLANELPAIISRFAWFHLPLSLFCVGWSIFRLRVIALTQSVGGKTAKLSWSQRFRPPVGELPMLWKELHIEGGMKSGWLVVIVGGLLVLLTLGSGLLIVGAFTWENWDGRVLSWRELSRAMNVWFRTAGTGVAGLMILGIAVRASSSISAERERDTFDAILTTPMSSESILAAKLLGSMSSLRFALLWCGAMLALAIFTGGVHLLAVPLLVAAFIVYALLFAMIGLWYSMVCLTSLRATVYTVLTTIAVSFGHWLITGMCCFMPMAFARMDRPGDIAEYLGKFQMGLTPPIVFGALAFSWHDLRHDFGRREYGEFLIFCLIGLFLSAMACVILWFGVLIPKFRQITRREELMYQ